jgi:2TM domain
MNATIPDQRTRDEAPAPAAASNDELRTAAIASLKRKRRFAEGVVAYVAVNGVLWLVWALTDRSTDGSIPWPAWVSVIWGFFLAIDAWKTYGPWPRSLRRPITEDEIEREKKRLSS